MSGAPCQRECLDNCSTVCRTTRAGPRSATSVRERQPQREGRTPARLAVHQQAAAVGPGHLVHERQPEAEPPADIARRPTAEAFQQTVRLGWLQAVALVR